ncbi:MAG: hypothetical protein LBK22_06745 [Tannerella sp.]|jgi:hypothetical protein|nr:hypothetical protein [Tannerella sp.]
MRKLILLAFACLLLGGQRVYSCPPVSAVERDVTDVPGDAGKIQVAGTAGVYEFQAPEELPVAVISFAFAELPNCRFYMQTGNRQARRTDYNRFTARRITPRASGRNCTLMQRRYGNEKY